MATTYRISASLRNVTTDWSRRKDNAEITSTGDNLDFRTITVTTGAEVTHTLSTDIGNAQVCYIYNYGPTNFINIGFSTADYPLRCSAGLPAVFEITPATTALFLRADTADCTADIIVTEV